MLRRAVRPITRARAVRPITRAWTRRYTAPPLRDMRFLLFEVHGITKHYVATPRQATMKHVTPRLLT